jgi:hypothetical protein
MPDRSFPSLEVLIRQIEEKASDNADPVAAVAEVIKLALEKGIDPYLLSGVLTEGIAVTITKQIPLDRQLEAAVEVARLLAERLRAHGIS